MARIIIFGPSEASRAQLNRLLSSAGHAVFRVCASEGELRRALAACEDGVALIAGGMPDGLADDLAGDFGEGFQILLIGRPEALAACESPRVFKLGYPCHGSAVLGAIEMLSQLHRIRLPRRSGEDRALVERAKRLMMKKYGIDEPEAHRRLQLYAMQNNMRMTDCAAQLLKGNDDV